MKLTLHVRFYLTISSENSSPVCQASRGTAHTELGPLEETPSSCHKSPSEDAQCGPRPAGPPRPRASAAGRARCVQRQTCCSPKCPRACPVLTGGLFVAGNAILSKDIVDRHREKTLALLWKIALAFQVLCIQCIWHFLSIC